MDLNAIGRLNAVLSSILQSETVVSRLLWAIQLCEIEKTSSAS